MTNESKVILAPGNAADDDSWRPEVSLEHQGSELYVVVGEEVGGMVEGVSEASFAEIRGRLGATDPLAFREFQANEHQAWLDVVRLLRDSGVGGINAGEPDERLHDAIVRWGEELAQLRLHDPEPAHAEVALRERRAKWEAS